MLNTMSITELESFIRLCDRKKEVMYRKISTGMAGKELSDEYNRLFRIADALDGEFDKRLENLKTYV